jgi:hypothetical protein
MRVILLLRNSGITAGGAAAEVGATDLGTTSTRYTHIGREEQSGGVCK